MANDAAGNPARIVIVFDPSAPSVPLVSGGGVTPWQLAAAAWELDRMARAHAEQMAPSREQLAEPERG